MSTPQPLMSLEGIVKTFPAVRALDNVSLTVMPGEVHALVGENGAGKSTLMKVLAGMHAPDQGRISIRGKSVVLPSPLAAKKQGVVLIHQELSLAEELSVAENIFLGELPKKQFGQVDWQVLYARSQEILDRLRCNFGPKTKVAKLSTAKKQMVEIARALTHAVSVVVFDEPTASLTDQEKVVLFDVIADLKAQGVGIVYISHRMEEIFRISDRISALRDGTLCGTVLTGETDEDEITRMMIGRSIDYSRNSDVPKPSAPIMDVVGLSCGTLFRDVSFTVSPGEVVGFYGLVGAGRTEIAETLFGLRRPDAGEIRIDGKPVTITSPVTAIAHGISLVPESRKEQGLVLGLDGRSNMSLPQLMKLRGGAFMDRKAELTIFDRYKKLLDIRTSSWRQAVGTLSGGNQQKVVIGKWLAMDPKVLIVDEPTRGIDVGAKAEIHKLIRELARSGLAVIVISSEMPEILHVSDRILALHRGRIAHEFSAAEVNEDNLVRAISGIEVVSTLN